MRLFGMVHLLGVSVATQVCPLEDVPPGRLPYLIWKEEPNSVDEAIY